MPSVTRAPPLPPFNAKADTVTAALLRVAFDAKPNTSVPAPETAPTVSVIIPCYGKIEYTLRCLASIAANPPKAAIEVIVVDDATPDDTTACLADVAGIRLIIGCRLDLVNGPSVLVYPTSRAGYSRLTRLLTVGKSRAGNDRCMPSPILDLSHENRRQRNRQHKKSSFQMRERNPHHRIEKKHEK